MMGLSTSQQEEAFMTFQLRARFLFMALLLAGALAAPAHAASTPATATSAGAPVQTQAKPAKAKKKPTKTNTVKYEKGSAETTAERDRRLFRECKGRPNGGACLGYAS